MTRIHTYLILIVLTFISLNSFAQAHNQTTATPDTAIYLENIDVQGKRLLRISEGPVKQLDAEADLSSLTGTSAEMLRQIPSFVTDIEGNTSFRGSSHSTILLRGVPYGLLEENRGDLLIQLPAFFFNRIRLSSVPDVDWIPDGDGSTLSLSSGNLGGSPLQVNLGTGWNERYNAGLALDLRPPKFNIAAKYNYRREYRERTFNKTVSNAAGTTLMKNNAVARPDVHLADLSIGYQASPKDLVSAYGLYHLTSYSRYGGIQNTKLKPNGEVANQMVRHRYNNQQQTAYATEAAWTHRFRSPSEVLNVVVNYNNFGYDEDNHFENENPTNGTILKQDNLFNNQDKHQYYLSAGYNKEFSPTLLFKGGYIGRWQKDTYRTESEDLKGGAWVEDPDKSSGFSFNRITNLLYASLKKDIARLQTTIGIQAEHTRQEAKRETDKQLTRDAYTHIYPQVRLAYALPRSGSICMSYIQRTNRPLSAELNPFTDRSDALYIKQGNPALRPEYIHLMELSYSYTNNRFRISPNVYYRYKTNRIMDVAVEEENQQVWMKENIGNTHTAGAEFSVYWTPVRFLSAGLSTDVFRDEIDGRNIGYKEKKSLVCWNAKGNINLTISPTTEVQLDGFYLSDQLTAQGKIKHRYAVNAGASQYLMQRKIRLNLSISNLFDSLAETTEINTATMQLKQVRNRDARVAWLTVTYRL